MKINPVQFNFIQPKPQSRVTCPLRMKPALKADTVNFTGFWDDSPMSKMNSLVPKHKGIVYKNITDENGNVTGKVPVEVDIVKTAPNVFQFQKDKKIIGRVEMNYVPAYDCDSSPYAVLSKTYKDEDIVGDRIEVQYIYNNCENEYSGVGHLSDLVEVAACKELGIKPNIISYSFDDVAPLHYKRGKRFIPYEKYCGKSEIDMYDLEGKNPNDTVREIVESTPKGKKFDTSPIKTPFLVMYMPKSQVKELEEELKEHPIF
ncbi:hypothetical protein IJI31_02935 [bacterium]|nr:hypothetical protein [bacterium]